MNTAITEPAAHDRRHALIGRLWHAEQAHDDVIKSCCAGVTPDLLAADRTRWADLGAAVAELAQRIQRNCAASAFAEARPPVGLLATRIVESIDDLLDPAAWSVVEAATQWALAQ